MYHAIGMTIITITTIRDRLRHLDRHRIIPGQSRITLLHTTPEQNRISPSRITMRLSLRRKIGGITEIPNSNEERRDNLRSLH